MFELKELSAVICAILFTISLADEWKDLKPLAEHIFNDFNASFSLSERSLPLNLAARQLRCANPGYVPCPTGPLCCPAGYNCVSDDTSNLGFVSGKNRLTSQLRGRCCPGSSPTCGGTGCYESGAVCCSGSACKGSDQCLLGRCCSKSSETCSGRGCWPRGATCCSNGVACESSQTCCGSGCCDAGYSCCELAQKCCQKGSKCCRGTCCPSGFECAKEYGLCQRLVASTSTIRSTATLVNSRTTRRPSRTESAEEIETPEIPDEPAESAEETSSCVQASPSPSAEAIKDLPVIEFIYIDTEYEPFGDIVKSMCLGMQRRNVVGNQDILTYAGSKDPCYKDRRTGASCTGCCSGVIKDSGPFKGMPTSCDEYPFASTVEGGIGATRTCVVAFQNSLQGGYLSAFYRKLAYGQQFVVRVIGVECSTVKDSELQGCATSRRKRQESSSDTGFLSGYEDKVRSMGYNNSRAAVISFGDLETGNYSSRLRLLSGQVDDVVIISNSGTEVASGVSVAELLSDGSTLDFGLDAGESESGVGALVYTSERSVNVSYEFEEKTTDPSASATGGRTSAASGVAINFYVTRAGYILIVCLICSI